MAASSAGNIVRVGKRETQPTAAAANGSTLIAVGKRPLGTFPETPPYQASF